ncbi:hypothetical protein SNEBB_004074 [Seison nebaliae]|nr:hypothetical protein SNEBB_004074 [Seison nebaliae]
MRLTRSHYWRIILQFLISSISIALGNEVRSDCKNDGCTVRWNMTHLSFAPVESVRYYLVELVAKSHNEMKQTQKIYQNQQHLIYSTSFKNLNNNFQYILTITPFIDTPYSIYDTDAQIRKILNFEKKFSNDRSNFFISNFLEDYSTNNIRVHDNVKSNSQLPIPFALQFKISYSPLLFNIRWQIGNNSMKHQLFRLRFQSESLFMKNSEALLQDDAMMMDALKSSNDKFSEIFIFSKCCSIDFSPAKFKFLPFTNYTLQIQRINISYKANNQSYYVDNKSYYSMGIYIQLDTLFPPLDSPSGLTVISPNKPTSVKIKWKMPMEPNGKIIKYIVEYRKLMEENDNWQFVLINGNIPRIHLLQLMPETNYLFRVKAENVIGSSPYSKTLQHVTAPLFYNSDSNYMDDAFRSLEFDANLPELDFQIESYSTVKPKKINKFKVIQNDDHTITNKMKVDDEFSEDKKKKNENLFSKKMIYIVVGCICTTIFCTGSMAGIIIRMKMNNTLRRQQSQNGKADSSKSFGEVLTVDAPSSLTSAGQLANITYNMNNRNGSYTPLLSSSVDGTSSHQTERTSTTSNSNCSKKQLLTIASDNSKCQSILNQEKENNNSSMNPTTSLHRQRNRNQLVSIEEQRQQSSPIHNPMIHVTPLREPNANLSRFCAIDVNDSDYEPSNSSMMQHQHQQQEQCYNIEKQNSTTLLSFSSNNNIMKQQNGTFCNTMKKSRINGSVTNTNDDEFYCYNNANINDNRHFHQYTHARSNQATLRRNMKDTPHIHVKPLFKSPNDNMMINGTERSLHQIINKTNIFSPHHSRNYLADYYSQNNKQPYEPTSAGIYQPTNSSLNSDSLSTRESIYSNGNTSSNGGKVQISGRSQLNVSFKNNLNCYETKLNESPIVQQRPPSSNMSSNSNSSMNGLKQRCDYRYTHEQREIPEECPNSINSTQFSNSQTMKFDESNNSLLKVMKPLLRSQTEDETLRNNNKVTFENQDLTAEMASLDCIMQDLNTITGDNCR